MSLRQLAEYLGISPSYLSDIEKGRRYAPENKLQEIIKILDIKDKPLFYDLASETKGDIPLDIKEYLLQNKQVYELIRARIYKEVG